MAARAQQGAGQNAAATEADRGRHERKSMLQHCNAPGQPEPAADTGAHCAAPLTLIRVHPGRAPALGHHPV